MRWYEAGGDSLGALQLWYHIESELGTQLPLDPLTTRVTPSELVSAIERILRSAAAGVVPDEASLRLPLVFLMPHAYGDGPYLAELRAAMKNDFRFVVIRYPELSDIVDGGGGLGLLVDAAEAQVLARCGGEACLLVGVSFGGFVAWETARRLVEARRSVGFLGLIDSQLVVPPDRIFRAWASRLISRTYWQPRSLVSAFLRWLAKSLVRCLPLSALRQIDRLGMLLPAKVAFQFRYQLVAQLRMTFLRRDMLQPLQVPTTLFRSDHYVADLPDHGWNKLCSQLVVMPVCGGHFPDCEDLSAKLVQAVDACGAAIVSAATPMPALSHAH